MEQRYVVTLSSLASNLLARFLDQQGAIHIAAIVNGKIAIKEVTDDFQHRDYYDLNHFIELPGYTYSTARPATNSKLTLGIPGRGKELAVAQSLSPIFHNVVPVEKGDALTRAWLDRLVRPKAILHSQSKKSRLSNDHKRNVTLFSTSEVLKQVDKDEAAGDPLCPSVLFSTIGNAQDNLISMHIHPNVTQVAAGFSDSMVRVWRLDNSQNLDNPAFGQSLKATAYSWNMNEVLPATKQALTDRHLDAAKETLLDQSSKAISAMSDVRYPCIELKGHSQPVFSVTQDSTERFIMSSSSDQTVRLWDTALLQAVSRYDCLSIPWDVKMHPLDYYFATANRDRSVMLYSTDRQRPVRAMVGHTSDVNTLCWHGNGLYLASGSDDKSARLWDIRKGDCVRILRGCNSPVSSLAISPLGNLLAVAGESGNIYLYDLIASKMLCSLRGHQGAVNSLAFSADGLQVVSGGLDCSVRVWSTLPVFCPEENGIDATLLSSQDQMVCGKLILKPRHSFFTKASPVYHVGYTDKNMVYAGGPCQAGNTTLSFMIVAV